MKATRSLHACGIYEPFYFSDGLPEVNAMKVVTESHATFCNIKCLDTPGCKSVVFLLSNSTDNCLLSNEMNGARADESVTYIKENHFTTVRKCVRNVSTRY